MISRILLLISTVTCSNILVYNPILSHSHVRFLGNIADLLAQDGHNVTVLSPIIDETVAPFGCKDPSIHKIIYRSPYSIKTELSEMSVKTADFWSQPSPNGRAMNKKDFDKFEITTTAVFKGLLEDKDLLERLRESKFDLGMAEMYTLGSVGLFELIGIKTSMVGAALGTSIHQFELTGLADSPSFVPFWITSYSENMTFMERFDNFQAVLEDRLTVHLSRKNMNAMFQEQYPGFPDLLEVMKRQVGVILSNVNEFTTTPRPTTNMFQYVGGANVHPPKPLSKDLDSLLSQRSSNVLFSLGTFMQSCKMPPHLKEGILAAFDEFPDTTFLWKYEKCENDTVNFTDHENVVPTEWVPQNDLLGDPRLSLFITHGGMNSLIEVSFTGKPSITIPLFADQYSNAKNAESRGLTVILERHLLSKNTLVAALKKTLAPNNEIAYKASLAAAVLKGKDEEYRKAIQRWARLLIEFGPLEHLRLPSTQLSFLQFYCIDSILFAGSLVISIALGVVILLKVALARVYVLQKEKEI